MEAPYQTIKSEKETPQAKNGLSQMIACALRVMLWLHLSF